MNSRTTRPGIAATDPSGPEASHGHSHGHGGHGHVHGPDCAHAHAQSERAPLAIAGALAICESRGLRMTAMRRQVLETLYATHTPMSAYDLIDALAATGEKRVAPITIYRALDFLLEHGFAHKLESRNAFIACPFHHGRDDLVVFLICDRCGGVDECGSDDLRDALAKIAGQHGFAPRARVLELAGRCAHCVQA